jgi:hypothetical protein
MDYTKIPASDIIEYPELACPQLPGRNRIGAQRFSIPRLSKWFKQQLPFDRIQYG